MFFLLLNIAWADKPQLQGYGELRFLAFSAGQSQWQTVERLRPSLGWSINDFFSIKSTLDLSLFQGRDESFERSAIIREPIESSVPPNIDGYRYSLEEICHLCGWDLELGRSQPWQLQLARFHIDITLEKLDLRLGRQAVEWSEMFVFNNSDPLPQNLIQTPWQERQGIDALRLRIPIGEQLDLDTVVSSEKISLRARTVFHNSDLSFMSHITNDALVFALNARGEHEIGWRTEWVYHHTERPFLHASVATDYTLDIANGILLYLQLTHDTSGSIPELYEWNKRDWGIEIQDCPELNLQVPELGSDIRQTLGTWYLIGHTSHSFDSPWQIRYATVLNLIDLSGVHMFYLQWNQDRFSVQSALLKGYGEEGEFSPTAAQMSLLGSDLSTIIPSWKWMSWFRFQY